MGEEQVKEPGAPYVATPDETTGEELTKQVRIQFPLYFERFLEERDRRLSSELARLEAEIRHNGEGISRLQAEMERRFAEAREERRALRAEMERRFAEAREERQALRAEMREMRRQMQSQFRWLVGLLFPLVLGVLAVIVRVFILGIP